MSDRDLICKNCGKEIEARGWTHDDSIFCDVPGLQYAEPAPVEPVPAPRIEMSSEQRGERPCKCGHAMSFHRHDDDLLQMECGANPDCGHFSCRFPWTPTDFAPRPECDCKNWGAPVVAGELTPCLHENVQMLAHQDDIPPDGPCLVWSPICRDCGADVPAAAQ